MSEFTELRRQGIGGSDWGGILYLPPWGCARRVYYDKIEPDGALPRRETGAMRRGHLLEELVGREYTRLTHRRVRKIGPRKRPHHLPAWWIGNPDIGITDKERGPGVLEIKTVGARRWPMVKDNPPQDWVFQLHHYLVLTGRKWGAIAALNVDTWELRHWEIHRSREMTRKMEVEGTRFWTHVQSGEEPDRVSVDAAHSACSQCRYRLVCYRGLDELVDATGEATISDESIDTETMTLVDNYLRLNDTLKKLKERVEEIKTAIKTKYPSGTIHLDTPDWKVSISRGVRTMFDSRAFKQAEPQHAAQYERESIVDSVRVTPRKKGAQS